MNTVINSKIARIKAGEKVVCSDEDMDAIEASDIGLSVRSVVNPQQVGTKDRWLAFVTPMCKCDGACSAHKGACARRSDLDRESFEGYCYSCHTLMFEET